jgi:hypothetical protein
MDGPELTEEERREQRALAREALEEARRAIAAAGLDLVADVAARPDGSLYVRVYDPARGWEAPDN